MTTAELRDAFVLRYKLECVKRDVKEVILPEALLGLWIGEGQQDICDKLKILVDYYDIVYTAVSVFTTYTLPTDFGKLLRTEPDLEIKDITEIITTSDSVTTGTISAIAVFYDGGYKATFNCLPDASGTVRVWYSKTTNNFTPALATDIGGYSNSRFTGSLVIPDKYLPLLLKFMLGQIFPDIEEKYSLELNRLRSNNSSTSKQGINYNLGGYSQDEY